LLQRRQHLHGGSLRLIASALLEAAVSALQAPVRMLAHTGFVLGALTGLRLEWRSPPRDARRVAWTDAAARLGVLCLPAIALAALFLPGARGLEWPLLPVLLPLALAVPMAVLSGDARFGDALRRAGLLLVDEEVRPPRTLTRAASTLAFSALQPAAAAPTPARTPATRPAALPRPSSRPARTRGAASGLGFGVAAGRLAGAAAPWQRTLWAGAATAVMLVATLPRTAVGPEVDPEVWWRGAMSAPQWMSNPSDAPRQLELTAVALQEAPARRVLRRVPDRPARYIDDAVRERALRAVALATLMQES
jgi:membrane glycosyltransferase